MFLRGLPVLALSFVAGYLVTMLFSLFKAPRGQRIDFIQRHAADASWHALLSAFAAFWVIVFVGIPIDLLIMWLFSVPFHSPLKFQILCALAFIIYVCVFAYVLRTEVPGFVKGTR
jgi:hypothetical protein